MSSVVVLGGSAAGLASGLLLARNGHQVTVLERERGEPPPDVDSAAGWVRPTVPQVQQAHSLMARARRTLVNRLPDVLAELLARGAAEYRLRDWLPATATGAETIDPARFTDLVSLGCRRTTLEWVLRRQASVQPGLRLRTGVLATGLRWRCGPVPRVIGVDTREHGAFHGDVVVDATGRRSELARWARDAGVELVRRDEDCDMVVYTRFFRILDPAAMPRMPRGNATLVIMDGFAAYAFLADNDTVAVVLARLPQDSALERLREPAVFHAVASSVQGIAPWVHPDLVEPISPVRAMAGLRNSYWLPLRSGRPQLLGLHSIGDALATTNPAFGRGVSLAMVHAEILADGLAAEPEPSLRQAELIGTQLAALASAHWRDATRQDRSRTTLWRRTIGLPPGKPPQETAVPMPVVVAAAAVDADIWLRHLRETHLLDSPGSVLDDAALAARIAELDLPNTPPMASRQEALAAISAVGRPLVISSFR
ncbi:MAG: NAD(P)/FAD-dependent oxidoreductase [Sciscionella sp.]